MVTGNFLRGKALKIFLNFNRKQKRYSAICDLIKNYMAPVCLKQYSMCPANTSQKQIWSKLKQSLKRSLVERLMNLKQLSTSLVKQLLTSHKDFVELSERKKGKQNREQIDQSFSETQIRGFRRVKVDFPSRMYGLQSKKFCQLKYPVCPVTQKTQQNFVVFEVEKRAGNGNEAVTRWCGWITFFSSFQFG